MKFKASKTRLTTYVALLRGINVAGNNTLSMADLKVCFEKLGHENVKTYINSGNVIFKSGDTSPWKIVKHIEDAIKRRFGLGIRVIVRTINQLKSLSESMPTD